MAVKVVQKVRPSGTIDDRLLRREISIGRRVLESGSDLLLPVIDAADTKGALLLVMIQADKALSSMLPMSESDAVGAMTDIAAGLQALHSIGIIHRDLKPPNVLAHEGHWKLADFGIARDQEVGTQNPTFIGWGSLPYMAPELWQLMSPTVKTDLYALGCLGFELLTGAPPYTGDQAALRTAHLTLPPPDVPCGNGTLKNLITRLISKNPEDRPQDARAALDRLHRAALSRSPLQESIARGVSHHNAEKSRAYLERVAAGLDADARRRQITQAWTDLREMHSDALEDLRAIEPSVVSEETAFAEEERDPWGTGTTLPWHKYFRPSPSTALSLCLADITMKTYVWGEVSIEKRVPDDSMLLAGCIYIKNGSCRGDLNGANIVYEQLNGTYSWRIYRFSSVSIPNYAVGRPAMLHQYTPLEIAISRPDTYDRMGDPFKRPHGLKGPDFLSVPVRSGMLKSNTSHTWTKTLTSLTTDALLELFREAVDLGKHPPGPVEYGPQIERFRGQPAAHNGNWLARRRASRKPAAGT